jgi:hypothetical protein
MGTGDTRELTLVSAIAAGRWVGDGRLGTPAVMKLGQTTPDPTETEGGVTPMPFLTAASITVPAACNSAS